MRPLSLLNGIKNNIVDVLKQKSAYDYMVDASKKADKAALEYYFTLGKSHPVTIQAIKDANDLKNELKDAETAIGNQQRKVGSYADAIVGAGGKAFGAIRQLAYIIPGLGIGGIFAILGEGVMSVASSFGSL